jgi:L-iditol 2-dehydrogenase
MPVAVPPVVSTGYQAHYAPHLVTKNPEFRVLEANDPKLEDKDANIACAYNPAHEIHMINKPMPKAGPGEVLIHVRSTGICG